MSKSHQETLNLPRTRFPMKANLASREPKILERWKQIDLYNKLRQARKDYPKFILHDGPPYANGEIHLGHAINKTLKDMVVRSRSMAGYDAPYVPGWDCHGLPIELNVEKKYGKVGQKLDATSYRKACRAYAEKQVALQRKGFIRLGINGDWDNPYTTMQPRFEASTVRAFGDLWRNGHIKPGLKPVHWCDQCGSALAEAEVEYHDHDSTAIDVRFALKHSELSAIFPDVLDSETRVSLVIWTTTPWTLPANRCVSVHPELKYQLVQVGEEALILAEPLTEAVLNRAALQSHQILGKVEGSQLQGLTASHPFLKRDVPVFTARFVTSDTGTGAVHSAPPHGLDDYALGQEHGLPMETEVQQNGCFAAGDMPYSGLHIKKANDKIVELLQAKNALLHSESYQHSYPYCWRHRTPLMYLATPQWFISMDQQGLRSKALEAINHVRWFPDWGQQRLEAMLRERPDWCISRQRTWGVPVPLFVHRQTNEPHPDTPRLINALADLIEERGDMDSLYTDAAPTLLGDQADEYRLLGHTLDVWFDSGSTHRLILEAEQEEQTDLYLEGSDQHRGWFQSSLLISVAAHDRAPYRQVLTHGFVVDGDGHKMSKSLGNITSPQDIIKEYGADLLRLWVASTDYRNEMVLSDEVINHAVEGYRRVRNTARFLLGNLADYDHDKSAVPHEQLLRLDRWAICRCAQLQQEIMEAYDKYQFHLVFQRIYNFCNVDMGSFYLDILKDRLYTMPADSQGRRSAQTAMMHILQSLVRWLAPILPFTSEDIWEHIPQSDAPESVHLSEWLRQGLDDDPEELDYWNEIRQIRDEVYRCIEQMRTDGQLGSSLQAEVCLYVDNDRRAKLAQLEGELSFAFICSSVELLPLGSQPENAVIADMKVGITVTPSTQAKCSRCWHYSSDIKEGSKKGDSQEAICNRCQDNVEGAGETRLYA